MADQDIATDPTTGGNNRQIIRREGEYWTVVFGGEICRLKDVSGLRYLAYLLLRPHQRLRAIEVATHRVAEEPFDEVAHERARVNVTRSLAAVLKRIEPHHPALAQHLRATLRTGRFCSYNPDPRIPVTWQSRYE